MIKVTPYQLEMMKHALGLDHRHKKPYRNYFFTQETDNDWNELVEKGLATKGTKHPNNDEFIYFWLTDEGIKFAVENEVVGRVKDE